MLQQRSWSAGVLANDTSHKNFGIVTDKFFASLVGGTVWLVAGRGRPRGYFLCSSFVVDKMERNTSGKFRNRATGSQGRDFDPFVEIGGMPWFPELLRLTGNFGLGLQPISNMPIIPGF